MAYFATMLIIAYAMPSMRFIRLPATRRRFVLMSRMPPCYRGTATVVRRTRQCCERQAAAAPPCRRREQQHVIAAARSCAQRKRVQSEGKSSVSPRRRRGREAAAPHVTNHCASGGARRAHPPILSPLVRAAIRHTIPRAVVAALCNGKAPYSVMQRRFEDFPKRLRCRSRFCCHATPQHSPTHHRPCRFDAQHGIPPLPHRCQR